MKALKSKLVKDILNSGIKIPLKDGSVFKFNGKEYTIKIVPKAH